MLTSQFGLHAKNRVFDSIQGLCGSMLYLLEIDHAHRIADVIHTQLPAVTTLSNNDIQPLSIDPSRDTFLFPNT